MARGGKRDGAGRKSGPGGARRVTVAFRLTAAEVAALDALRLDDESRSATARRLLTRRLTSSHDGDESTSTDGRT